MSKKTEIRADDIELAMKIVDAHKKHCECVVCKAYAACENGEEGLQAAAKLLAEAVGR